MNKFLILLILCGSGYIALFSVHRVSSDNEIGIVEDRTNKRVARTFSKPYNFIWEGAFPNWYSVYMIPCKKTANIIIRIPIPQLEDLKGDGYTMIIPLSVDYAIDGKKFYDFEYLADGAKGLNELLAERIKGYLMKELKNYFYPVFRREALNAEMEAIIKKVYDKAALQCRDTGLELSKLDLRGTASIPDYNVFNEGQAYIALIRKNENENEIELKKLKYRLERDKIEYQEFYSRLNKISEIVKKNPDMLKYIYIEKMAEKGRIIPSAEDFGNLKIFNDKDRPKLKKGDIDNLR